jgi:hypothetical protein
MSDIATILSSGALSSAIVYLFRNWISERIKSSIQHEYDQKLETHKAQLKAESEISIEKWKAELARQHFQYSHIFKRTEEIIAETYKRLLDVKSKLEVYTILTRQDPSFQKNTMDEFWLTVNGFKQFFDPNRIYLPKQTVKQIEELASASVAAALQFNQAMSDAKASNRTPDSYGKVFNNFFELEKRLPHLLGLLEDDFQAILGFPIHNKSAEAIKG